MRRTGNAAQDARKKSAARGTQRPRLAVLEPPGPEAGAASRRLTGVVLGRLVALRAPGWALVSLKGMEQDPPIRARRLSALTAADRGREVALMFEDGDPGRPLVIGCVEAPPGSGEAPVETKESPAKEPFVIDAATITFTGEQEIVLRCGPASITLRKDGRVVIRGAYVETRSQGVNRIKGGSVQIN